MLRASLFGLADLNMPFALAIHGGAGVIATAVKRHGEAAYLSALHEALDAGKAILAGGGKAMDAVEAAVSVLEDSTLFNAGRGSVFCEDGTHGGLGARWSHACRRRRLGLADDAASDLGSSRRHGAHAARRARLL